MLELIDGRDQLTPVRIGRPKAVGRASEQLEQVRSIVEDVQLRGDDALIEHTERLDRVALDPERLRVDQDTLAAARSLVRPALIDAFEVMAERLRRTCERQLPRDWFEQADDETIGEVVRPLRRVGAYVPGGRAAYPSTVIMTSVPARVAGVEGIAVCSPPGPSGEVAESVLAACSVAGVDEVYRIGGAQAIAALAYGTASVRPVEKIVGPGNVFVTQAKRLVAGWVGVDAQAGPTEIAIVADTSAPPQAIAADLIAQAEHGPQGAHVLITWVPDLVEQVGAALELQVARHERFDEVENALIEGGAAVLVRDLDHALDTVNSFAPEHLELLVEEPGEALPRVRNAGAVFLGAATPVSVGDYVAGTNHVLPTGGSARWSSGLSVRDFVKQIYVAELQPPALARLAPHVDALAEAEGLRAHARAVHRRFETG